MSRIDTYVIRGTTYILECFWCCSMDVYYAHWLPTVPFIEYQWVFKGYSMTKFRRVLGILAMVGFRRWVERKCIRSHQQTKSSIPVISLSDPMPDGGRSFDRTKTRRHCTKTTEARFVCLREIRLRSQTNGLVLDRTRFLLLRRTTPSLPFDLSVCRWYMNIVTSTWICGQMLPKLYNILALIGNFH